MVSRVGRPASWNSKVAGLGVLGLVGVVLLVLGLLIGVILLQGWLAMLLIGTLFPLWSWPAFGYGTSILIVLGLQFVGGCFKGIKSASS